MIYLTNTTEPQTIYVPSGRSGLRGSMRLVLSDGLRLAEAEALTGSAAVGYGYVRLRLALPEGTPDGEYRYTLVCGNEAVTSGVARVGAIPAVAAGCYESAITYKIYGD